MGEGIQKIVAHVKELTLHAVPRRMTVVASSKNKTFLAFCFSFIVGVSIFSFVDWLTQPEEYLFGSLFVALFGTIIFWHSKMVRFYALLIFFFLFGAWRTLAVIPDCSDAKNVCYYNGKTVTMTGWIAVDPDRRADKTNYVLRVSAVDNIPAVGDVLVQVKSSPFLNYGDAVNVKCKIQAPRAGDDGSTFRYDKYLADQGEWSLCSFPQVTYIDPVFHWQNVFMSPILAFKNIIAFRINALWPQPESSFLAGILYGSKAGLPKEISDNFSRTGITHIIAVSGFNITIIATALMTVLISAGLWRRQAFWGVLVGVWVFKILSGLSASAVRAAVMGTLALTAQYLGRESRIGTALVFTAAFMAFVNPFVVMWDAGFQLSFLATIGLVYVSPILEAKWRDPTPPSLLRKRGDRSAPPSQRRGLRGDLVVLISFIREPLLTTLSAIIATTPLIMYQFGRLSLVAPLVNVLVLWIVSWLMLGGFIVLVVSFVFFPLSQAFALIVGFGLRYVIMVANLFGSQSWSAVTFQLPWWGMVILYLLLFDYVKTQRKIHAF